MTRATFRRWSRPRREVIGKLKNEGCKQDELDKAVRATLGGLLRQRSTTRGMASSLASSWLAVGNLDYDRAFLDRVSALTVEGITEVAAPLPGGQPVCPACLAAPARIVEKGRAQRRLRKARGVPEVHARQWLTLLVGENPRLPLVSVHAQFLAGVPVETDANAGVTQVTAQLLTKGTATRSDEQIAALLEDRGGQLISNGDAHRLVVGADVMKGDEILAMGLLRDLLTEPMFPESHLTKVKKRQAATIREETEDPLTVAPAPCQEGNFRRPALCPHRPGHAGVGGESEHGPLQGALAELRAGTQRGALRLRRCEGGRSAPVGWSSTLAASHQGRSRRRIRADDHRFQSVEG